MIFLVSSYIQDRQGRNGIKWEFCVNFKGNFCSGKVDKATTNFLKVILFIRCFFNYEQFYKAIAIFFIKANYSLFIEKIKIAIDLSTMSRFKLKL